MTPLEYRGQYAACKVFTDNVDGMVVQQIYGFLNSPAFEVALRHFFKAGGKP